MFGGRLDGKATKKTVVSILGEVVGCEWGNELDGIGKWLAAGCDNSASEHLRVSVDETLKPLLASFGSGLLWDAHSFDYKSDVEAPNDPKLSDGGGWRDGCAGAGGGAASVTAGAVR